MAREFHQESVTEPVKALVQYSEDLLDARRAADFVLIRSGPSLTPAMLQKTRELLGGLDQVWIARQAGSGRGRVVIPDVRADRNALPAEVGLVYDATGS